MEQLDKVFRVIDKLGGGGVCLCVCVWGGGFEIKAAVPASRPFERPWFNTF
jgi:hypothetical protein